HLPTRLDKRYGAVLRPSGASGGLWGGRERAEGPDGCEDVVPPVARPGCAKARVDLVRARCRVAEKFGDDVRVERVETAAHATPSGRTTRSGSSDRAGPARVRRRPVA